jgi:60 kDa SS-A/Ro ribonucleoprotein
MKRTVGEWYTDRTPQSLANQLVKYRQRNGWSHRDLLRLAKPKIAQDSGIFSSIRWAVGKEVTTEQLPPLLQGYLMAQAATKPSEWVALVKEYNLPWEALPTEALNHAEVWEAMMPHLGLTALLRNLGKMGSIGMTNHSSLAKAVNKRLDASLEEIRQARLHPMQVLLALTTYTSGRGVKGKNTWNPIGSTSDAVDALFYKTFGTLESTGKRRLLALDVSGSMTTPIMNTNLSCREATAALALVALNQDPDSYTKGFSSNFMNLEFSSKMRLKEAIRVVSQLPFDRTDCSLPIEWALKNNIEIDSFEVYTDSETYAGRRHPTQALAEYRSKTGINAKLVVNGMTATHITIADPNDPGMLDVVGFDASAPQVITDFIR